MMRRSHFNVLPIVVAITAFLSATAIAADAKPIVTDLAAKYQNGQVFLTWKEAAVPEGTTFNVYSSAGAISAKNIGKAKLVCRRIGPRSAYDWWLNPETHGRVGKDDKGNKPAYPIQGFVISKKAKPLSADSGLYVHTVAKDETGPRYYAVTCVQEGKEDKTVVAGQNALKASVEQKCAATQPIWQGPGKAPTPKQGKGKMLLISLHGKESYPAKQYLAFGDSALGWREGLPFKFDVEIKGDLVTITPCDRTWVNRVLTQKDTWAAVNKLTPAIHTWWYGYTDKIYDAATSKSGTPTEYTERRLLWIINWAQTYFQTDKNRTYCTGSSMGGCGVMSFALRHPEIFAAVFANVPFVAYGPKNAWRISGFTGPISGKCADGQTLKDRLDSALFVKSHPGDLPFLGIVNGRSDGSIPWKYSPDLFRALNDGKHGFVAAWNDGGHGGAFGKSPKEFQAWRFIEKLSRIALNKSYPAFSSSSKNGDPGNGDKTNGVTNGTMNFGFDWDDPKETPKSYEVLVRWTDKPGDLPVTVDITPRRVQAFKLKPGQTCKAVNIDKDGKEIQKATIKVDKNSLITFPGFKVTSAKGNRLVITR